MLLFQQIKKLKTTQLIGLEFWELGVQLSSQGVDRAGFLAEAGQSFPACTFSHLIPLNSASCTAYSCVYNSRPGSLDSPFCAKDPLVLLGQSESSECSAPTQLLSNRNSICSINPSLWRGTLFLLGQKSRTVNSHPLPNYLV